MTDANVNYEGSITIDRVLMNKVGLREYERVQCGNLANGERFETYAIAGESGSGAVFLNGATAHLGKVGDQLTIMSFGGGELATESDCTWRKQRYHQHTLGVLAPRIQP